MYNPRPQFNYTPQQDADYHAGYSAGYYGRSMRGNSNEYLRGFNDGRKDQP